MKATHPDAKDMFRPLLLPFDRLESKFRPGGTGTGGTVFVSSYCSRATCRTKSSRSTCSTPLYKNSTPKKLATGSGFNYTPFEFLVLEQVNIFLNKTENMNQSEQLDYASRAVAAGLRWHLVAVNNNKRVGKAWEGVAALLRSKMLEFMRERFEHLMLLKKYDRADEVGLKMLSRFPNNLDVQRDVYRLQLLTSDMTAKGADPDLLKLRESLLLYERLPGKKDEGLIRNVRHRLRSRATTLMVEAKDYDAQKMAAAALAKLRTAEMLDPDLPGIDEARTRLRGKVFYVGVAKLPEKMSPATAITDAERWATELIFEGLLQTVPDSDVIRYRPGLAENLPAVMPLGRSFTLPKNVRWSRDPGELLDARDIQGTLDLLRNDGNREGWSYDGLEVFHEVDRVDDPFRLRLAYDRGVLEPLGRATFKVIPARHLKDLGKKAHDPEFARAPFGSGPFRYEGREREGLDRECAVFRMNPYYGQRAGKFGLPWVREIRMYVPTQSTLMTDVPGRAAPPLPGRTGRAGSSVPHRGSAQGRNARPHRGEQPTHPHARHQPSANRPPERQDAAGDFRRDQPRSDPERHLPRRPGREGARGPDRSVPGPKLGHARVGPRRPALQTRCRWLDRGRHGRPRHAEAPTPL